MPSFSIESTPSDAAYHHSLPLRLLAAYVVSALFLRFDSSSFLRFGSSDFLRSASSELPRILAKAGIVAKAGKVSFVVVGRMVWW